MNSFTRAFVCCPFRRDDPDYADAIRIETALGIPVLRHDEKKPGGIADVLAFFEGKDPEGGTVSRGDDLSYLIISITVVARSSILRCSSARGYALRQLWVACSMALFVAADCLCLGPLCRSRSSGSCTSNCAELNSSIRTQRSCCTYMTVLLTREIATTLVRCFKQKTPVVSGRFSFF